MAKELSNYANRLILGIKIPRNKVSLAVDKFAIKRLT